MYTQSPAETLIIIASASKLRYIPLAYLGNVIEPSEMSSSALKTILTLFSVGASLIFSAKNRLLFKKLQQRMERQQESFLLLLCQRATCIHIHNHIHV